MAPPRAWPGTLRYPVPMAENSNGHLPSVSLTVRTRPSGWRGPLEDQAVLTISCTDEECDFAIEHLVDLHQVLSLWGAHRQAVHEGARLVAPTDAEVQSIRRARG